MASSGLVSEPIGLSVWHPKAQGSPTGNRDYRLKAVGEVRVLLIVLCEQEAARGATSAPGQALWDSSLVSGVGSPVVISSLRKV